MKHVGLLMAAGILVTTFSLAGCGGGSGVGGGVGGGVGLPPGFSFLGIALVGRPDGSSTTAGFHTDITVARGLNTATPTVDANALSTILPSVDALALSDDATVGVVDGGNSLAVIRGMNTATPTVTTAISAPDGGASSGVMVNNDDKTGLLAGNDGVHRLLDLDKATFSIGPALAGGFRANNDSMVYTQDKTTAVLGSGFYASPGSGGNQSVISIVRGASTAAPSKGPDIQLGTAMTGYAGRAGMCISPADPTRMTVATLSGVLVITGLDTAAPVLHGPFTIPDSALPVGFNTTYDQQPLGTAISRDGTRVAVLTFRGMIVMSGVDTASLTVSSNYLSLDPLGVHLHSNLGVALGLDGRAVYATNNNTQRLYVVTGFNTSTITLSQALTLLPSEGGAQHTDALLLH